MSEERRWLARYCALALAIAGGLEWFLGRTISRLAAAPPLEGPARTVVEALGRVGLFLVSPSFLLAALLLLLACYSIAARSKANRPVADLALAIYLAVLLAVVVAHTFMPTQDWLNLGLNILSWVAVWWIAIRFLLDQAQSKAARAGIFLAALAYTGWYAYVVQQLFAEVKGGSSDVGVWALSVGELLAVLAPFAFFAAIAVPQRQWRHGRRWIFPAVLAAVVAGGSIADTIFNQGFTGVLATWSLGFNIAWPWPIYAVSIALFTYSLLTCFFVPPRRGRYASAEVGLGLLFMLLAGYNMQIPYQHVMAILGLLLLCRLFEPLGLATARSEKSSEPRERPVIAEAPERGTPQAHA